MITLLDSATGTTLWNMAESAGVSKEPVWKYNIEHPEFVVDIHKQMIAAGSNIIYTNTFGANRQMVKRSSDYEVEDIVRAGVKLAKQAAEGTDVKVALSVGPLSELLEPYGDLEEDECFEIFDEMMKSGASAECDLIVIETFIDLEMAKIAVKAAKQYNVPVFATLSFEKVGKTIMGQSVEDVCRGLEEAGADAIGMNCSLGPELALPVIEAFSKFTKLPLVYKPNAGLPVINPDGSCAAAYTPEMFVSEVKPAFSFISYVGGCCNTTPDYIKALKEALN